MQFSQSRPGLTNEMPNVLGNSLFFRSGEVKVTALGKEILGDGKHEVAQGGGEKGRIQGVLGRHAGKQKTSALDDAPQTRGVWDSRPWLAADDRQLFGAWTP